MAPKVKQGVPKPALKIALRTPTPKGFSPKTDNAKSSSPGSFTGARPLRSVQSLLRRKSSATSSTASSSTAACESVVPKPMVKQTESNIPVLASRTRSRTGPGTFLNPKVSQDPPSTPQPGKPKEIVSNVPQPRGESPGSVRFLGRLSDESDFEYHYDAQNVVANAEVFASSSSSESAVESFEVAGDDLPSHMRGLGFRLPPEATRKSRGKGCELLMTEDLHSNPKEASATQSIISYVSSDSEYVDDGCDVRDHGVLDVEAADQAHHRRKAELMSIVKGLQLSNPNEKKVIDEESDYSDEEGLAISGPIDVIKHGLPSPSSHFPSLRFHARPKSPIEKRPSEAPSLGRYYQDRDSQNYDAVTLAEHSQIAAARERRAFGIPPLESDEVYETASRRTQEVLSHADSILPAMGSEIWHNDECDELSLGADVPFRTFSGGRARESSGQKNQQQQPRPGVAEPRKSRTKSGSGAQSDESSASQNLSEYVQHGEFERRKQPLFVA